MPLLIITVLLIDFYTLNALRRLPENWRLIHKKWFRVTYLAITTLLIVGILLLPHLDVNFKVRLFFIIGFFALLLYKVSFAAFALIDDLRRFIIYTSRLFKKKDIQKPAQEINDTSIPRSEFLLKAGLLAAAVPLAALKLEMKSGLYDYHVKHQPIYLPNLPKAFNGIRIAQISDIHSGSFFDKKAVMGGVEMLMREKADVVFFTGDLVSYFSNEMRDYQDIFAQVKAPLGVFSSFGNHDYGDYNDWISPAAKKKNHDDLIATHKNMGWDLLRNENRRLKVDGEEIGILGIENWGELSSLPRYGRMDLAVKNTDDLPVKLLLSHDPSHWRAQVLPSYPQIDVAFAGHTHGMQLGVQTKHFQWSPIEYIYREWAGLYQEGKQQLYVNVGYGFLGIPGRVGILPEITIFELKSGPAPHLAKT